MRLLHTFNNDRSARIFSRFLEENGLEHSLEISTVTDWGSEEYGTLKCQVWVINEDDTDKAHQWLSAYLENPNDPKFKEIKAAPPPKLELAPNQEKKPKIHIQFSKSLLSRSNVNRTNGFGALTFYLILFCTIVFFATQATKRPFETPPANIPLTPLFASPIKKKLLYDYPATYEKVDQLVKAYGFDKLFEPQNLPPGGKFLLLQMYRTPHWQGFYPKIVAFLKNSDTSIPLKAPLFEKIRKGQLWRLVTPIFMHADLFHLFFNMIWLLVLGMQMEKRLGIARFSLFIIFSAILSNTSQYLMSGPDFLGFSGVLCAMIVFIWLKQKSAPWEGYHLQTSTMAFISIFIVAMVGIQLVSFLLEVFNQPSIAPPIANTAHLTGALSGFVMFKLPYWKIQV